MPPQGNQRRRNFSQRTNRTSPSIPRRPANSLSNLNRARSSFSRATRLAQRTRQFASRVRRVIPGEINKSAMIREEMRKEREEIRRIREEIARMLNLDPNKLGKDRKIEAIAMSLHSIYGSKIPREKLKQVNNMLMQEFSPKSPFLKQSPTIRKILEKAEIGHINTKKNTRGYSEVDVLTKAISDLMEKHEMT